MARVVVIVVLLLIPISMGIAKPHIFASWMSQLRYFWRSGRPGDIGAVPQWANYYISGLPREMIPSQAKNIEEWVRMISLIVLILPLTLIVIALLIS